MPEYPDIIVYLERLRPRIQGQRLEHVRLASPFLLRTVDPPLFEVEGKIVGSPALEGEVDPNEVLPENLQAK